MLLQGAPLARRDGVAAEVGIKRICVTQCVVTGTPVIRQQYHTVYIVYLCFGIADTRSRAARVEHVPPFVCGQRAPLVRLVAAITDGIVAPIGLARLVVQVVLDAAVGIVVAISLARAPRLVANGTMVVAACTPAEKVYPTAVI